MTALGIKNKGWIQEETNSKYCRDKENKFSVGHAKCTSSVHTFGI